MNSLIERVLEQPAVYRLWQAPFVNQKLAPVTFRNDFSSIRRVLDVGCGPGTNTRLFSRTDYLGIDINPRYIAVARRRSGRDFVVADVTTYTVPAGQRFDFILVNSFLHHIDLPGVERVLAQISKLLTAEGSVHILELALPARSGLPKAFARLDRGRFPRPLEQWQRIFTSFFELEVLEPYQLTVLGLPWLDMVYFKGRAKR